MEVYKERKMRQKERPHRMIEWMKYYTDKKDRIKKKERNGNS